MLIYIDPPDHEAPKRARRTGPRDYIAIAAVILAILVSVAGACVVVLEVSGDTPAPVGRLTITTTPVAGGQA